MSTKESAVVVPTDAEIARYADEGRARGANGENRRTWSARDLIRHAKEHPPEPIIEGLLEHVPGLVESSGSCGVAS